MSLRTLLSLPLFLILVGSNAFAEGFSMTEWSARGLSLAGGLVARADDASAVAYNPAGITQLPGVHLMAGISLIAPYGQIETREDTGSHTTDVRPASWFPPQLYATWQLNDDWWLGFGVFSRFGLGNQYSSGWVGRNAIYNVGLQTISANPVIAYKVNDWLSLSLGVELMYLNIFLEQKIQPLHQPNPYYPPFSPPMLLDRPENNMNLKGDSWGVGMNAAAHIRFNDQWSAGLTYRSQMTQNVNGRIRFDRQYPLARIQIPGLGVDKAVPGTEFKNAGANATIQLPDSAALAVMWKPLSNLSFEVGTVWTRWSTYNALNIYTDAGLNSINQKSFRDGWNFNASVEYSPLDWLSLRLGYWHETPVVNEKYADYLLPTNGRDGVMTGVGFKWNNWTLDLAYAHLWIYPVSYDQSAARAAAITAVSSVDSGLRPGTSKNTHAEMFSVSLGYSF
ncbi:MAG: outer membrane protein transport protein [Betaproteobacteria bacterium]|nr:outer membrane protein transport protein [Betaproteobacteria bacterium]